MQMQRADLNKTGKDNQRRSISGWLLAKILPRFANLSTTGHSALPGWRPRFPSLDHEQEAVEDSLVERSEPRIFKGLSHIDFNEYLCKHGIVSQAGPLTSRLKEKRRHGDPNSKTPGAELPKTPKRSPAPTSMPGSLSVPSSPGHEVVRRDGQEEVTTLMIAQELVGQVHTCRDFIKPESFLIIITEECDTLLQKMLGREWENSKPWAAFQASAEAGNEIQFILELYLDAFQYLPRHCSTKCNMESDAWECCWEQKFGYPTLQSDNRLRLATLIDLLRRDLTRATCNLLKENRLDVINFPDHVHIIMEHWMASAFDDQIAGLPSKESYRKAGNHSLAEKTGLLRTQVKQYKERYRSKKYSFETRQDEFRVCKFDGCEKTSGMTKYAIIVPCVRRYAKRLFAGLPKAVQAAMLRKAGMFSSVEDKHLHIWYNRIRRTEIQQLERRRSDLPIYYSVGFSKF